jgi:hypothetical protein
MHTPELEKYMDDLKIKFDGQAHSIDANTLINSLLHFTTIAQAVNAELAPDKKVEIKITAFEEGSFLVHILLQTNFFQAVSELFTADNMKIAGSIATGITGIYKLAKELKGQKPKSVEVESKNGDHQVRIENVKGDVFYIDHRVYNTYANKPEVQEALKREFETLENDPNISGFELLDKNNKPLVQIGRDEFNAISNNDDEPMAPDERNETRTGMLSIHTLSFDRKVKWSFYYEGNRISAKIGDDVFVEQIDKGEKFAKGDSLEAEIEVRQQYDKTVNAYINKSYKVLKILRHIPRSEQTGLDFPKH